MTSSMTRRASNIITVASIVSHVIQQRGDIISDLVLIFSSPSSTASLSKSSQYTLIHSGAWTRFDRESKRWWARENAPQLNFKISLASLKRTKRAMAEEVVLHFWVHVSSVVFPHPMSCVLTDSYHKISQYISRRGETWSHDFSEQLGWLEAEDAPNSVSNSRLLALRVEKPTANRKSTLHVM